MEITFNAYAYAAGHHDMERIKEGKSMPYISAWADEKNWPQIGTAVVTVTLYQDNDVQAKELERLNKQLQEVRAENQQRENAILDQISNLQALTFQAA